MPNNAGLIVREVDDRRVRKTRQALVHALVELVLEKRYDAITIQNLLDRADVGRATFYAHYRGKDDLLFRSFEGMLDMMDGALERDPPGSRRVAPVRELFAHVGNMRRFQQALARAHVLERQYQLGIDHLTVTIERRLGDRVGRSVVPPAIRARSLAGSLFALLRWWIEQDVRPSPDEMDRMFHAMCGAP